MIGRRSAECAGADYEDRWFIGVVRHDVSRVLVTCNTESATLRMCFMLLGLYKYIFEVDAPRTLVRIR